MKERRANRIESMIQTRMFLGALSIAISIGSVKVPQPTGFAWIVQYTYQGYLWPVVLGAIGTVCLISALLDQFGKDNHFCREVSVILLAANWLAILFASLEDGIPDPITFVAPVFIFFCAWAAWAQARNLRCRIIASRENNNAQKA